MKGGDQEGSVQFQACGSSMVVRCALAGRYKLQPAQERDRPVTAERASGMATGKALRARGDAQRRVPAGSLTNLYEGTLKISRQAQSLAEP